MSFENPARDTRREKKGLWCPSRIPRETLGEGKGGVGVLRESLERHQKREKGVVVSLENPSRDTRREKKGLWCPSRIPRETLGEGKGVVGVLRESFERHQKREKGVVVSFENPARDTRRGKRGCWCPSRIPRETPDEGKGVVGVIRESRERHQKREKGVEVSLENP
ncbi:hypothetical protein, partial [Rossellomorea vietnamensis]|uniref:hypothetical protein n=1 Tax=Rossellomorea vietnamensis TaxID=218284 RepID=UPI001C01951E